jgi:hypothetical protein
MNNTGQENVISIAGTPQACTSRSAEGARYAGSNLVIPLTAFRRKSIVLGVRGAPSTILDNAAALLKEFLHRVVSLYIRLKSYIPEAVMIKTPAEIFLFSSTFGLHRPALLLFAYGLSHLRKWRLRFF